MVCRITVPLPSIWVHGGSFLVHGGLWVLGGFEGSHGGCVVGSSSEFGWCPLRLLFWFMGVLEVAMPLSDYFVFLASFHYGHFV